MVHTRLLFRAAYLQTILLCKLLHLHAYRYHDHELYHWTFALHKYHHQHELKYQDRSPDFSATDRCICFHLAILAIRNHLFIHRVALIDNLLIDFSRRSFHLNSVFHIEHRFWSHWIAERQFHTSSRNCEDRFRSNWYLTILCYKYLYPLWKIALS